MAVGVHMYHWEIPRALSNREKARLQTFPDNYEFWGGVTSVRKQIGMAVPPYGAKPILEMSLATLADAPSLKLTNNVIPERNVWKHLIESDFEFRPPCNPHLHGKHGKRKGDDDSCRHVVGRTRKLSATHCRLDFKRSCCSMREPVRGGMDTAVREAP